MDRRPDAPPGLAVGTEFHHSVREGQFRITEVAFVNIETGQLVVNAVFRDDQRAVDASTKLKLLKSRLTYFMISSTSEQVSQVRNVMGVVQQLKDGHLGTNDLFIEYSSGSHSSLAINNVRLLLARNGSRSLDVLPANNMCRAIEPIRAVLGQPMKFETWSQPILFRILFPRHPLV